MPTPLDIFMNPIILIILGMYALLMIWEAVAPARQLPAVAGWKFKGLVAMVIYVMISVYLPLLYANWLPSAAWLDASQINFGLQCAIGILTYEIVLHFWHHALHKSDFLWKIFHQMHHSAERIDTFGAFYFSPMDMMGFTMMITFCFSFIVALSPMAVTVALLVVNFLSIFQHTNVKTPVWLGYIIQRPESHAAHHGKGVHANNYCDLPLIEMIFGTFSNPESFPAESGFYHGASNRIIPMVLFKDISQEKP